jgi:preprotein translocase subunit SecE
MIYISKAVGFLKEVKSELGKVHWPKRKETINYTLVVVGVSFVVAIILGGLDLLFAELMSRFVL